MTTLEVFRKALGWHEGTTLHKAKERFAVATLREQDHICSMLIDNISEIEDLQTVQYFTDKRLETIGLHQVALNNT